MELTDFLKSMSRPERAQFAQRALTTLGYLEKVSLGDRTASAALARNIHVASGGVVTLWSLRPDDWWQIWPEQIANPAAPAVSWRPEPRQRRVRRRRDHADDGTQPAPAAL